MGGCRIERILEGADATRAFAAELATSLLPNAVLALYGSLGAGKTTFLQGLLRGLGGEEAMVHSPTFVYLHHYPASIPVYHFDLYRLKNASEFLAMGFEEVLEQGGVAAIEWPERIAGLLPEHTLKLHFETVSQDARRVVLS